MNPPLVEVNLTLNFPAIVLTQEKLRYFHQAIRDLLPHFGKNESSELWTFQSESRLESMAVSNDSIQLLGLGTSSFTHLRPGWERLIAQFLDVMDIPRIIKDRKSTRLNSSHLGI